VTLKSITIILETENKNGGLTGLLLLLGVLQMTSFINRHRPKCNSVMLRPTSLRLLSSVSEGLSFILRLAKYIIVRNNMSSTVSGVTVVCVQDQGLEVDMLLTF